MERVKSPKVGQQVKYCGFNKRPHDNMTIGKIYEVKQTDDLWIRVEMDNGVINGFSSECFEYYTESTISRSDFIERVISFNGTDNAFTKAMFINSIPAIVDDEILINLVNNYPGGCKDQKENFLQYCGLNKKPCYAKFEIVLEVDENLNIRNKTPKDVVDFLKDSGKQAYIYNVSEIDEYIYSAARNKTYSTLQDNYEWSKK